MKKLCNSLFSVLLGLVLTLPGCQSEHENATEDTVQLAFTFLDSLSASIKIGALNSFSSVDSTLAERELDSIDTTAVAFTLSKPTLVYLQLDETWHELYLTPGDDLKISVSSSGDQPSIAYTGIGSEVNNYLARIAQVRERLTMGEGTPIWQLEKDRFMDRLDSMKDAYDQFHRAYVDTVPMPEKLSTSLESRNRLKLVSLKENYELVHYSDRPDTTGMSEKFIQEKSKDAYYDIPFDSTLLNNSLLGYEYAVALKMYLDLYVAWPLYNSIPEDKIATSTDILPLLADSAIRSTEYPAPIREFLIARNVTDFLNAQGITPVVDTILTKFKKEYPTSTYTAPIEDRYEKWRAIAPGRPAPDFTGTTPEGKKLSLSDLKGKVVYVDVWATWCGPCIKEFPHSKSLQKQFEGSEDVVFLYVSVDRDQEKWKKMVAEKELKGAHIIDPPEEEDASVWKAYLISGIPRYILIDQTGKIVDAEAARPSSDKVQGEIQKLLDKHETAML